MKSTLSTKILSSTSFTLAFSLVLATHLHGQTPCAGKDKYSPQMVSGGCTPSVSVTTTTASQKWGGECLPNSQESAPSYRWSGDCSADKKLPPQACPRPSSTGGMKTGTAAKPCQPVKLKQGCGPCPTNYKEKSCRPRCEKGRVPVGTACMPCPKPSKASQWASSASGSWLASALSSSDSVAAEFDAWELSSGERPTLVVELGDTIAPSRTASFPSGLSSGREVSVRVKFRPAPQWASFESRVPSAIASAYQELSSEYYRLGTAHQKASLLALRQKSLESIRESNRVASNEGRASWTEVVYLDSLVESVSAARATNQIEIDVLSWGFQGSPHSTHLRAGKMFVWSPADFWSFYAKTPPTQGEDETFSPKTLSIQFGSLMAMRESSRLKAVMSALYDQVESETEGVKEDMPAAEEILTAAKASAAESRLGYIEAMLLLPPPVKVELTKLPPVDSLPSATSPPAPSSKCGSADTSGGFAGKVTGVLLLIAGAVFLVWERHRTRRSSPTEPPKDQ